MKDASKPPFHRITDWKFVDATTGAVLEEFKMREFFEWDREDKQYKMVRHYQLAFEDRQNPNREGL